MYSLVYLLFRSLLLLLLQMFDLLHVLVLLIEFHFLFLYSKLCILNLFSLHSIGLVYYLFLLFSFCLYLLNGSNILLLVLFHFLYRLYCHILLHLLFLVYVTFHRFSILKTLLYNPNHFSLYNIDLKYYLHLLLLYYHFQLNHSNIH